MYFFAISHIFSHILTFLHIFPWIHTLDTLCLCDWERCSRLSWLACLLCWSSLLIYLLLTWVRGLTFYSFPHTKEDEFKCFPADVTIVRGHGIWIFRIFVRSMDLSTLSDKVDLFPIFVFKVLISDSTLQVMKFKCIYRIFIIDWHLAISLEIELKHNYQERNS